MSEYEPPREIVPIFNPVDWIPGGEEALTIAEGDGRYLKLTGGTEKGPVVFTKDITLNQNLNFVSGLNTGGVALSGADLVVEGKGTGDVILKTGNTNRVVVDDAGNMAVDTNTLYVDATNDRVGVDRTPTTTNLEVRGGGTTEGIWVVNDTRSNLHLGNGIADNSSQRLSLTQNGTSNQIYWTGNGDLNFAVGTTPAIRYVMNGNNGRMGIYDTTANAITPERALHVRGDAIRLDRSGQSPNIQLHQYAGGGFSTIQKGFAILVASVGVNDGQFQIQDYGTNVSGGGTTRFTINNTGAVGIGTTTPSQLLEVNGGFKNTGTCILSQAATGRYLEISGLINNTFIDFHSLDSTNNDYDTRIISTGGTAGTSGQGALKLQALTTEITGNIILRSSGSNPTASTQLGGLTTVSISNTSLPVAGTATQVASVDIPFGVWQVNIVVQFRAENFSNWREMGISFLTTSASVPVDNPASLLTAFANKSAGGVGFDTMSFSRVIQLTSTTTYYLNAFAVADSATVLRVQGAGTTVQLVRIG